MPFEKNKQNFETEDDKLEAEFVNYIVESNTDGVELREAYYELCGVTEVGKVVSQKVEELKQRMEHMTDSRFPLNRFVKIITGLDKWENSVTDFTEFVNDLNITSNEKNMLFSIINEHRNGELECTFEGRKISIKIAGIQSLTSEAIAYVLKKRLEEAFSEIGDVDLRKGKISFQFEEH